MIDYSKIVPQRVATLKPSGIRKFFDVAATMEDVVSLGVGEPDFVTPEHIRKAGAASLLEGHTKYTQNPGLPELREDIAAYLIDLGSKHLHIRLRNCDDESKDHSSPEQNRKGSAFR